MSKLLLILIILFSLSSCSKIFTIMRKDTDTEGKTDIKSKFNDDNKIYTTNRLFTYDVHQIDSARELSYKMELLVIPGKMSGGTKIKYKYYYPSEILTSEERKAYLDSIKNYKIEITSITEDPKSIFVHPPRAFSLKALQLSPFPQIDFPTKAGYNWSAKMYIMAGWGELNGETVKYNFVVDKVEYSETDSLNFTARIKAESYIDEENHLCNAMFDFDSQLGFTNMSYAFDDSTKVEMRMVE